MYLCIIVYQVMERVRSILPFVEIRDYFYGCKLYMYIGTQSVYYKKIFKNNFKFFYFFKFFNQQLETSCLAIVPIKPRPFHIKRPHPSTNNSSSLPQSSSHLLLISSYPSPQGRERTRGILSVSWVITSCRGSGVTETLPLSLSFLTLL